jgi:hypothetical protein
MVEPSTSNGVKHLPSFIRTAPPFVGCREELTSSPYLGRLAIPISGRYKISTCLAMRPFLISAGKVSSQKEELP